MPGEHNHRAAIADWLEKFVRHEPAERQSVRFVDAFNAVWQRALQTLGEVTLHAIGERVLHNSAERFPIFRHLTLETDGLDGEAFEAAAKEIPPAELTPAIAYALTELLTVLGRLTGEILTPALHAVLSATPQPDRTSQSEAQPNDGKEGNS